MTENKTQTETSSNEEPQAAVDESLTSDAEQTAAIDEQAKALKVKKITQGVLIACVLLFVWYLIADRVTPNTDQARLRAYVVPVVAEVAGTVIEIGVDNNEIVKQDSLLFRIDPEKYQLAVVQAEADLEMAGQAIGADLEAVSAAQANVLDAQAHLTNKEAQAKRTLTLTKKGIMAQSFGDQAVASVAKAKASLAKAQADLRASKQKLGSEGENNPRIRNAIAALRKARLDLQNTVVTAPHLGVATNVQISVGHYAQTGAPLMTFISAEDVWIEAYMRENNLENIKAGDDVEMVLDAAPGRVFKGKVASVGFGVNWDKNNQLGQLQTINTASGWLREAQRMPVIIQFTDDDSTGLRRVGGQVDVIVYTGDGWIMNSIGKLWIRFISLLSYAY
ncbi:HlyD family secretion protein [Corallincola holothuriorum]|uniref:HlyD family secretion protein n=1 Tax=Corallincola holothuriorum TaxID=2282215 RepID=A0A368N2Q2_9GAMM|nr:HlyD family secretion protein [Corallincola holothuriorum]RCU43805.1 HlyD family secretion protein [Corallincola holothuriorum]